MPDDAFDPTLTNHRTGADAFKALALGAHAVEVGRLYVWGMAHEGESGCRHVMKSLLAVSLHSV